MPDADEHCRLVSQLDGDGPAQGFFELRVTGPAHDDPLIRTARR